MFAFLSMALNDSPWVSLVFTLAVGSLGGLGVKNVVVVRVRKLEGTIESGAKV